ncbi:MAG TPA: hypothetical protein VGG39_36510 [Polyangiaceae bacterium]|jgi:hypothetical protein
MWTRRPSDVVVPALLATYVACFAVPAREALAAPPPATTMDDPIAQFRERFKQGMDRYKAGAPAEAIGYWEPIYRELGEQKGYRLAYDLGIAYEELGDATRAADRLQSFLAEVDARRGRSETLAAIVAKEEGDARQRMADLVATKGRISVQAGTPPAAAQVDAGEPRLAGFVAWVTPGDHAVTFAPGTPQQETKSVTVHAGEKVDVTPSPPAPPPPTTAPPSLAATVAPAPPSPEPPPVTRREARHPFSPVVLGTSGLLAIGAGVAAIPLRASAESLRGQYANDASRTSGNVQSFYDARTWSYVSIGATLGLAAVTAGLATWYFLGTSSREVVITPGGIAGRF